jgi:hypothetical protein
LSYCKCFFTILATSSGLLLSSSTRQLNNLFLHALNFLGWFANCSFLWNKEHEYTYCTYTLVW